MRRIGLPGIIIVAALGLSAGAAVPVLAPVQYVIVSCTPERCEYQAAVSVTIGGKPTVRLGPPPLASVTPDALQRLAETKLETIAGLYRDSATRILYGLGPDGAKRDIAMPLRLLGKDAVTPANAWQDATIEYMPAGAKVKATKPLDGLAYLLVSTDSEQAVFQLLQRLIAPTETDPRRAALIRGAVQFNASSPTLKTWKDSLLVRIRDQMKRFDEQTGDPSQLSDALREAVQLRAVYLQVDDDKANKDLLDHVEAADTLFARRLAIAEALRSAALWDDYLLKMGQIGMARWSMPDALKSMREAVSQSSLIHRERAIAFTTDQHFDRAFDEAQLAARNACDTAVLASFTTARTKLVNRNRIAQAADYTSPHKDDLEQIVRGLDQLDANKEQITLDRIREGEAMDPNYLDLQWKKAEFLDKLGRYTEALAVLYRIERTVPLDSKQLDRTLRLDGTITVNLADALQKSRNETVKAFDEGRYQDVLTAAARGLKAEPINADLLYYSAMSAAFLRQTAPALAFIQTYLAGANMTCTKADEPAKVLDLYRSIAAPVVSQPAVDGIPNWISGVKYQLLEAFYDPISLGFLQPIRRISSKDDGTATAFQREDRSSYLVTSIVTSQTNLRAGPGSTGAETVQFDAAPKYDPSTLSMVEIGPRSTSAAARPSNRLTYLNSPIMDIGLVFKFTGRQVARGWAGNPYFLPFVWDRFYFFDLTYDELGRVVTATPASADASARPDPASEPLQFTWIGDSKQLQSVRGKRSGYLRQLNYDKTGRLISEVITTSAGGDGKVEYEYYSDSAQLKGAKYNDNFWDKRTRDIYFDWDAKR